MILFLFSVRMMAQEGITAIWHPELSSTWKIKDRWELNFKSTAFNVMAEPGSEGFLSAYNLDFLEVSTLASYTFFNNQSIGLGFLNRWSEPFEGEAEFEKRLTEQFGIISRMRSIRWGHRFRLEQRWNNEGLVHRFRYRISMDKPLRGVSLDPGEPYFIGSNEILFSGGKPVNFFAEYRLAGGVGWLFSRKTKLEVQAQYRANGILEDDLVHLLVIYTTFYMNF
jgi:hypothetical protein